MKRQSEKVVTEKLKDIINQLTELSEGYLNQEEFETYLIYINRNTR